MPSGSLRFSLVVGLLALSGLGVSPAGAGPSGAIFTTDAVGSFVNGNVYEMPEDVYLNGGPRANAPCTAAGLPPGDYYFQVTDPSGQELLSSDPLQSRKVHVNGGVITQYLGAPATHAIGSGKCGSVTVQLCPFAATPNQGDEYKVWMILVSDHEDKGGFSRSASKTDNFKVAQACPAEPPDPD